MSDRVRSYASDSAMHSPMAACSRSIAASSSLPVDANGETLARWQISLASRRPSPVDDVLVAQPAVQAHLVLAEQPGERGSVEVGRLGAEAVERLLPVGVARHHPHAGLALGAGLGQQQRPAVGERPAGLPALRLRRLLLVGLQPAALHQVHDERDRLEPQQQVLAPPADLEQRVPGGLFGGRGEGLERGERQRSEAAAARRRRSPR